MRGSKMNADRRTRNSRSIFIVVGLCCFFYVLGAWQKSGTGRGDSIALRITRETECAILPNLHVETHHSREFDLDPLAVQVKMFQACGIQYTDFTPCQDEARAMKYPQESMIHRERHCPHNNEKLRCLIPAPVGYVAPFPWPKSRDYVPYSNVPHKSLSVEKSVQNWVHFEGAVFRFPGGGTMFPRGAGAYIDELSLVIPFADGTIRTALDIGCGVASFGAYLFDKNILTMSFAPRDSHEAQIQFALERGIPAVIGVLGTVKLPYPSRAFDLIHCSHCSVPWTSNEGMYMMEVDRILKPGGHWILSGPPINWDARSQSFNISREDLAAEQRKIESLAEMLCWEKKNEKGDVAVWQKNRNAEACQSRKHLPVKMCSRDTSDNVWYKKMEVCLTSAPAADKMQDQTETRIQRFSERLHGIPERISRGYIPSVTVRIYEDDNRLWVKHLNAYKRINRFIGTERYRNIMDMNAGFGSFAAALEPSKSWVMNVVPTIAQRDTLGVIYDRGLIGIYHDWCEAFSTYPRTYDLIHARDLFSLYEGRCEMEDILLEMDRILRPEGAVILRDNEHMLNKVRKLASSMRWKTMLYDHEDGPLVPEKILVAVKEYWVGTELDATS